MIVSTEAIVLRTMKFRDTSKIVTLYTRKFGKIKVLAKGARAAKNKFGASLEPMTHSHVVLYKKENRELHLLSKSELQTPFHHLFSDGEKITVGLAVIELVNMVMHDEEENETMFQLVAATLLSIDRAQKNILAVMFAFQIKMLQLFGVGLSLEQCSHCEKQIGKDERIPYVHLLLTNGKNVCASCGKEQHAGGVKVTMGAVRSLQFLYSSPIEKASSLLLSSLIKEEILSLLQSYMQYHIEGVRTLKSLTLL